MYNDPHAGENVQTQGSNEDANDMEINSDDNYDAFVEEGDDEIVDLEVETGRSGDDIRSDGHYGYEDD